jgi:2,3-bisphosphoglycerate-dependent phosphoglycerate mutase
MQLILLRHGESQWNRENRFTGWTDIDLNENGVEEAQNAAMLIRNSGFQPDLCFTSYLRRSIKTLWIVLEHSNLMWLPVNKSWRLNERHYGALQGLNKAEMAEKVGKDKVTAWRRSFDIRPPELGDNDRRLPHLDPRYDSAAPAELPRTESLKDMCLRVTPYWHMAIVPSLRDGKRVLISAHGNSIRGLVKHLDNIPDEEIPGVEIPTGQPLAYEFDENVIPINSYYLGDTKTPTPASFKASAEAKER